MTLKLTSLELTNFRRFATLHVDFHPNLTVLIAPNGGGKTAVLDAIALVLYHHYIARFGVSFEALEFRDSDHRRVRTSTESHAAEKAGGSAYVTLRPDIDTGMSGHTPPATVSPGSTLGSQISSENAATLSGLFQLFQQVEQQVPTDAKFLLPVVAYYSTVRRLNPDLATQGPGSAAGSRLAGYAGCLDSGVNYQHFLDRFAQWYRITSDAKIRAMETGVEYEPGEFDRYMAAVRQAVDTCLAGTGWGSLNFSVTLQSLTVVHETMGEQQVGMLSEGVRSVLAMAADIAHRCVVLNPHRGAEACSSPGVVLIDELDLHLHPEWQQRIIESLRTAFPNIQFIVTTHSPQVLTTVTASQIRVLPDIGTDTERADEPDFNPLAHSAGDALSRVMGVAAKPTTGDMGQIALNLELYKYELRRGRSDSERARQAKEALDALGYELERADLAMWKALGAVSEPSEVPTSDADSAAGEGPAADA